MPGETNILFNGDVGYVYPHRCWSCMVPCLIREDFVCDEVDGKMYTYCSEGCRWTHKVAFAAEYEGRATPAMGRFSGRREWEDCYHGWDVADAIKDLGFVRPDGKTLIAQPHLRFDAKDMWTLDDVRGHALGSPLRGFRALTPERARRGDRRISQGLQDQSLPLNEAIGWGPLRAAPILERRQPLQRVTRPITEDLKVETNVGAQVHNGALRACGHRDGGRRGRDRARRRVSPGHLADARLQGRSMRQLQVETDRRRYRTAEIFDLRAARLRERNRVTSFSAGRMPSATSGSNCSITTKICLAARSP